jgi:GxxExxY protein
MEVHRELGTGFLEAVYQEALALEFKRKVITFKQKTKLEISYKGQTLSKYYEADFVCYNKIILEIKAMNELSGGHESQVINYLKTTDFKLGLLINFGAESLEYKRLLDPSDCLKTIKKQILLIKQQNV